MTQRPLITITTKDPALMADPAVRTWCDQVSAMLERLIADEWRLWMLYGIEPSWQRAPTPPPPHSAD
jgi:hypothetical protein